MRRQCCPGFDGSLRRPSSCPTQMNNFDGCEQNFKHEPSQCLSLGFQQYRRDDLVTLMSPRTLHLSVGPLRIIYVIFLSLKVITVKADVKRLILAAATGFSQITNHDVEIAGNMGQYVAEGVVGRRLHQAVDRCEDGGARRGKGQAVTSGAARNETEAAATLIIEEDINDICAMHGLGGMSHGNTYFIMLLL